MRACIAQYISSVLVLVIHFCGIIRFHTDALSCGVYVVFELSWYFWKHVSGTVNPEPYTYVVYGILYCSSLYAVSVCVYM